MALLLQLLGLGHTGQVGDCVGLGAVSWKVALLLWLCKTGQLGQHCSGIFWPAVGREGKQFLLQSYTALSLILFGFFFKIPSRKCIPQAQEVDFFAGHELGQGYRGWGSGACAVP